MIVGGQKCGTTTAINTLKQHPDVDAADEFTQRIALRDRFLPKRIRPKQVIGEPQFFTYRWRRGLDWYMGLFSSEAAVVGEKTPSILHHEAARERMAATVPDAKIIILVREPVRRSYSQWNHYNDAGVRTERYGWIPGEPFSEAMRNDRNWIFTRSLFATHIRAIDELYPPGQVFIGIAERIKANPEVEYNRIFEFLGVDPHPVQPISITDANVRSYAEPIDPSVKQEWDDVFRNEVAALRSRLDDPIPEWP